MSQAHDAGLSGPTMSVPGTERGGGPTGPTPDRAPQERPPYWRQFQDDPAIQQVFSRSKKVEQGQPIPSLGAAQSMGQYYGRLEHEVRQGMERLKCSDVEPMSHQSGWGQTQSPAPRSWAPPSAARPSVAPPSAVKPQAARYYAPYSSAAQKQMAPPHVPVLPSVDEVAAYMAAQHLAPYTEAPPWTSCGDGRGTALYPGAAQATTGHAQSHRGKHS